MDDVAKTLSKGTITKKEYIEIPSDEAIIKEEEDMLNRKSFVRQIVNLIEANIKPPYSIGIYGDWGSGKTSIMRLIEERIKKSGKYRVIWFDAWEYENEANLIYPLVYLIKKDILQTRFKKVLKKVPRMLYAISKAGMEIATRVETAGLLGTEKLEKYERDYFKEYGKVFDNWVNEVGKVKEEFRDLTQVACKPRKGEKEEKKCMVIFIDDLDRCLPESSIKILESIKNIFSQGNCIFILGVDKRTISRVIMGRYPTLTEGECKDYLAKIVPFGLDVPECEVPDFDKYFKYLMSYKLKIDLKTAQIDLSFIPKVCASARLHNPRKIKRALVAFYLYYKIKQSSGFDFNLTKDINKVGINDQDVLMFCLLYEFWIDLFEKVLVSNLLLRTATAEATNKYFADWQKTFSDEKIYPVLKDYVSDENLYHFLKHWEKPTNTNFVNVLIRVGKLIGLKKE